MLPWSYAIVFGRDFFINFPISKLLIYPTIPIFYIQNILPFGSFILFIILLLAIAQNPKVSIFIRFNTMQALLINIALIIINYGYNIMIKLLEYVLFMQTISNIIFISSLSIIIFAVIQCSRGIEPDLPGISNAARIQV